MTNKRALGWTDAATSTEIDIPRLIWDLECLQDVMAMLRHRRAQAVGAPQRYQGEERN